MARDGALGFSSGRVITLRMPISTKRINENDESNIHKRADAPKQAFVASVFPHVSVLDVVITRRVRSVTNNMNYGSAGSKLAHYP